MSQILFLIRRQLSIFIKNIIYSEKLTYYPEEQRKSKIKILLDNLIWILRFHQANENYFILGFDRKNYRRYKQKYISGRKCLKLINHKKDQFNKNYKEYDVIIHDKFIAGQYLTALGFPVPATIALVNNNKILLPQSGDEFPLDSLVTGNNSLFRDCICKPVGDWGGSGVFRMEINHNDIIVNDNIVEQSKLKNLFSGSKYIIQEKIIQHEKMSALNPHSVNTIRLVTCIDHEIIKPFSALLRLGMKGKITDNWHTGGIIIRLKVDTGCLDRYGFTMPKYDGKKYERHPETGEKFEGYQIPFFHQAVELATKMHRYFYCTHSIGWDIAITNQGPVFIEANQGWDPYGHLITEDDFMDKFMKLFK